MQIEKNWKYYTGITLFIYSFIPYLVAATFLFLHIPTAKLLVILGIFIASAEISFLVSAALLGKVIIEAIKSKLRNIFKRRPEIQPVPIGKVRHYTGIVFLLLSFLPYFIAEFLILTGYLQTEKEHMNLLLVMLSGDAIFIISLFMLGAEFWERLKRLFEWRQAPTPEIPDIETSGTVEKV